MMMPEPSEREIQSSIVSYLEMCGWLVVRVNSGAVKVDKRFIRFNNTPGCSDLLVCRPDGRFAAIECKRRNGRLTPLQASFLDRVKGVRGLAVVARSIDDLSPIMDFTSDNANYAK